MWHSLSKTCEVGRVVPWNRAHFTVGVNGIPLIFYCEVNSAQETDSGPHILHDLTRLSHTLLVNTHMEA